MLADYVPFIKKENVFKHPRPQIFLLITHGQIHDTWLPLITGRLGKKILNSSNISDGNQQRKDRLKLSIVPTTRELASYRKDRT